MRPGARGRDRRRRGSAAHHWAGGAGPEVRAACRLWSANKTRIAFGNWARFGAGPAGRGCGKPGAGSTSRPG
jgi:hypothetical protein